MDPEECAGVSICKFHRGIHGDHISGHPSGIRTRLNLELLECYALQQEDANQSKPISRFADKYLDMLKIAKLYLHCDRGFHRPAGTPQNQGKDREENKETKNKSENIATTRDTLLTLFILEKTLFLNHIALLPGLLTLSMAVTRPVVGRDLAGSGFQRPREPTGGGLSGVAAHGGMGMRWGSNGAEHRRGVERRRGLLPIVGIP